MLQSCLLLNLFFYGVSDDASNFLELAEESSDDLAGRKVVLCAFQVAINGELDPNWDFDFSMGIAEVRTVHVTTL